MQGQPQQKSQNAGTIAKIHYFDSQAYEEVVKALQEMMGFVLGEAQKPEPLDQAKLGQMLTVFVTNCIRKGPPDGTEPPSGSTCEHVYVKGDKEGQVCGKNAKYTGVDGKPKCSNHKKSKPRKSAGDTNASVSAAGKVFSYADNISKGKTTAQSLTTIQAAIYDQQSPAELKLVTHPDGRMYNKETGIVFEQQEKGWTAIGVMDGDNTSILTEADANVCYGNQWPWDESKVHREQDFIETFDTVVVGDHPLVQDTNDLIKKKMESISSNSQ